MGKKSTRESVRLLEESLSGYNAHKYINEKLQSYFSELIIDFRAIYSMNLLEELKSDDNIATIFVLIRGLEVNPQSWYFVKKGQHKRPFTYEESVQLRHYESSIRMNLKKNQQKKVKFEYPWKDENVKSFGSKKMSIPQLDKILAKMREQE